MLLASLRRVLSLRPLATTSASTAATAAGDKSPHEQKEELEAGKASSEQPSVPFSRGTDAALRQFGYYEHEMIVRDWRNWDPSSWTPWVNFRMKKNYKHRQLVEAHGEQRTRYTALATTDLLPDAIKEQAALELAGKHGVGLPKYSDPTRLKRRCNVTSRGHGNVYRYRVSRFIYRDEADHGRLAGVIRARWG